MALDVELVGSCMLNVTQTDVAHRCWCWVPVLHIMDWHCGLALLQVAYLGGGAPIGGSGLAGIQRPYRLQAIRQYM